MQFRPIEHQLQRASRQSTAQYFQRLDGNDCLILTINGVEVGGLMVIEYIRMTMPKKTQIVGTWAYTTESVFILAIHALGVKNLTDLTVSCPAYPPSPSVGHLWQSAS